MLEECPALNSSIAPPHAHCVLSMSGRPNCRFCADLPAIPRDVEMHVRELRDSIPTSSRDTFDSFCSCVSNPSLNPALTGILSMDFPAIAYCWWTGDPVCTDVYGWKRKRSEGFGMVYSTVSIDRLTCWLRCGEAEMSVTERLVFVRMTSRR